MEASMSKISVALAFALGLAAGCGGGSSGFSPGVTGSKPLGELSGSEAKTLCENTTAHFRAQLSSSSGRESDCRLVGATVASGSAATATSDLQIQLLCTAGYTVCQQTLADGGLPSTGGDAGADPCAASMGAAPSCTATVDQYTACINESEAALSKYPTCSQLTMAKLAELAAAPGGVLGATMNGPACQAFVAACPGFNIRPGLPIPPLAP
jgi:hypothetical protein